MDEKVKFYSILVTFLIIVALGILGLSKLSYFSYPSWDEDDISLMVHSETGEYACFGCGKTGPGNAACVDPIIEMRMVEETKEFHCLHDFSIFGVEPEEMGIIDEIDFFSCNENADCIKVDSGCCGCNAGGSASVINKEYEEEWISDISSECAAVSCIQVISDDPTCDAEPVCIENKCFLS